MKPLLPFSIAMLAAASGYTQLSLTPQIGFEQSRTSINYNQLKTFSPAGAKTFFRGALKADYRTKKGHGVFAGIGTSPSVFQYSFANPSDAFNNYKLSSGALQWRLEAGYQYTSKKINFKTSSAQSKTTKGRSNDSPFGCGAKKSYAKEGKSNTSLRLQPFLGLAYQPFIQKDIVSSGTVHQYNAGDWNTAMVTGMGFEFARGNKRIGSLGFTYTKGLGNLGTKTITTTESGKTITNSFSSKRSNWGLTFGIPISLYKTKKPTAKKYEQKQNHRSRCDYYKSRCIRMN